MLPIDKLAVRHFEHAPAGTIGWASDFAGETFFIGSQSETNYAASFGGDKPWSTSTFDFDPVGLFVEQLEFRVDHTSFSRFDHLDQKIGALVIHRGEIQLCAATPTQRGYIRLLVGKCGGEWSDSFASAFTRWKAITYVDAKPVVLFSHG